MVKPVEINVTEAAKRYKAGESLRKIALALGCSQEHVRKNLKAAGVEMRERKRPRTRNVEHTGSFRMSTVGREALDYLCEDGRSQAEEIEIAIIERAARKRRKTRGKSRS